MTYFRCVFMNSGDASISRSLCPHCNRPKSTKGEFTTCEGWCVKWVNDGTHTRWLIFVDLQLGSPPLDIEGEKHNKDPILLSDDEEDYEFMKRRFSKILIILRMCILAKMLVMEGKEEWWSLL